MRQTDGKIMPVKAVFEKGRRDSKTGRLKTYSGFQTTCLMLE